MVFQGKAIKYGNNVDTDVIIPARYLNTSDKRELALHCMEDIDREFLKKVKTANIVVAGYNFGCGSSREHAPIALKESGVTLIIAKSFARIFYRNSINIGLAIVECEEAANAIEEGHEVRADLETGELVDITTGKRFLAQPFPEFIQKIVACGGLVNAVKMGEI